MIVAPTVAAAARRSRREFTLLDMGFTSLIAAGVELSDPRNAAESQYSSLRCRSTVADATSR